MKIDKDANMGTGNTIMEFNIGQVEHLNTAVKTVVNNYYGTRVKPQADSPTNKEAIRAEILKYVGNTVQFVKYTWKGRYLDLWADILDLPAVDSIIYNRGHQEHTSFNRKEVAHIICYLGKYADGGIGIFEKYVASHIAASFKDGSEASVRPELGYRPSKVIQDAIDTLIEKKYGELKSH